MSWLKWIGVRAPILPVAWVLAHATVLLWKALDPRYIDEAQWIVDVILKPLHPLGVWLVGVVMPPLRTLVSNMPPTHLDADKVLYGFLVPVYLALILGLLRLLSWVATGRKVVGRLQREVSKTIVSVGAATAGPDTSGA